MATRLSVVGRIDRKDQTESHIRPNAMTSSAGADRVRGHHRWTVEIEPMRETHPPTFSGRVTRSSYPRAGARLFH